MSVTDLAYALAAHANGFAVVPPAEDGTKRPAGTWKAYQDQGPDEEQIRAWYQNERAGFGVLCGAASGNLEMFEVEGRAMELWSAFRAACRDRGAGDILKRVIDGYAEITPSGGIHLLWRCPDGIDGNLKLARRPSTAGELAADPANKIQVLMETRGEGGYTILSPSCGSVHPTGKAWDLKKGGLDSVAEINGAERAVLLEVARSFDELPHEPTPVPASRPAVTMERFFNVASGGSVFDRVVDDYNRTHSWDDALIGWQRMHTDSKSITYWCRPGKQPRDGHSATTNALGTDRLIVFSSSVEGFETYDGVGKATSYDRFSTYAILRHRGDRTAAFRELKPSVPPINLAPPEPGSEPQAGLADDWRHIDLTDIANGVVEPPTPTLLVPRGSTEGLIYPGRVNSLFGESGTGKTWVALAAIRDVIKAGASAVLIDYEDTVHGIYARLLTLGLEPDELVERFGYVAPETAWRPDAAEVFREELAAYDPALVVIDSTGEAMAAAGVKGNDDDDVARWFTRFPKEIARRGPAVFLTDHVPKDPTAPSGYAIGSQRKRAAVNGAAYRVDAVKVPSRGKDGVLKIITAKDRHGWHTQGRTTCMVNLTHVGDQLEVVLVTEDSPEGENFRPTHLMERLSRYIEIHPDQSKRIILSEVEGRDKYLRDALEHLISDAYVIETTAKRGSTFRSSKPYRVDEDTLPTTLISDRGQPRPTAAQGSGRGPERDRGRPPYPSGGAAVPGRGADTPEIEDRGQPIGPRSEQPRFPLTPDNADL